jgi:hypothetical protein
MSGVSSDYLPDESSQKRVSSVCGRFLPAAKTATPSNAPALFDLVTFGGANSSPRLAISRLDSLNQLTIDLHAAAHLAVADPDIPDRTAHTQVLDPQSPGMGDNKSSADYNHYRQWERILRRVAHAANGERAPDPDASGVVGDVHATSHSSNRRLGPIRRLHR